MEYLYEVSQKLLGILFTTLSYIFLPTYSRGLRNEKKESRQMRNIFQSRRGPQASENRSERFSRLSGDDVAIPMCPIAQTIVIIRCSFVLHATFLHHASGSGILSFTFRVDQPGSQHRKGIGKGRLKRFRHVALSPVVLVESVATATFAHPFLGCMTAPAKNKPADEQPIAS